MIGHPAAQRLIAHVDDSLTTREQSRVKVHLIECYECRQYVQLVQELLAQARQTPTPAAREDSLERILGRWNSGERVILPIADPPLAAPRIAKPVAAAAAVVAMVAASIVVFAVAARADHSELRFLPANPTRGEKIQVEYRSTSYLGGEDSLVLRARYRGPNAKQYNRLTTQTVVAQLKRHRGGRYTGSFELPDSAVYAAFALEDKDARRVDSNARRLWELLTYEDSIPEYTALVQKSYDLMGRNWELAFNAAREATRRYPQTPMAWRDLGAFESRLLGTLRSDSLNSLNAERYERLNGILTTRPALTDDELAGMYWVALAADRRGAGTEYWRQRLHVEAPYHPDAVQDSANVVARLLRDAPARAFTEFERLWFTFGPAHPRVPAQALALALDNSDWSQAIRWAARLEAIEPWRSYALGIQFAAKAPLRAEGIARLRRELMKLETMSDSVRDLTQTRDEWHLVVADSVGGVNAALGHALIAAGDVDEGLERLEEAAMTGWSRPVFLAIAQLQLAEGNTGAAVAMFARIAADPSSDSAEVDAIDNLMAQVTTPDQWSTAKASATELMFDRTRTEAVYRNIDLRIPLLDGMGNSTTLRALAAQHITLVAFWSRHCAPSFEELGALQTLARDLQNTGARVVAVTDEQPSAALRNSLAEVNFTLTTYHDAVGAAARVFNSWATPEYYLLDEQGRLAFALIKLVDVERYVALLSRGHVVVVEE